MNKAQLSIFVFVVLTFLNVESSIKIAPNGSLCPSRNGCFNVNFCGEFFVEISEDIAKVDSLHRCQIMYDQLSNLQKIFYELFKYMQRHGYLPNSNQGYYEACKISKQLDGLCSNPSELEVLKHFASHTLYNLTRQVVWDQGKPFIRSVVQENANYPQRRSSEVPVVPSEENFSPVISPARSVSENVPLNPYVQPYQGLLNPHASSYQGPLNPKARPYNGPSSNNNNSRR